MSLQGNRYPIASAPTVADGWRLERVTAPSRLFGANGLRTGPDGRVYVAQVTGSQISALDLHTGSVQTVSPKGGDIIAPDDIAFDPSGTLYATEVMDGRVSALDTSGRSPRSARRSPLRERHHRAPGPAVHRRNARRRATAGTRPERRRAQGARGQHAMPNAMEVGPDGLLYFPVMGTNEIWRIDPDGGEPQRVTGDLGVPDSVKFDSDGLIVSTQVASGQVLRIDPRTGDTDRSCPAEPRPGQLHLCRRPAVRLELLRRDHRDSSRRRNLPRLPAGLNWPTGSGGWRRRQSVRRRRHATSTSCGADGSLQTVGMLFSPGYPGFPARSRAGRRRRVRRDDFRRSGRSVSGTRRERNRYAGRRIRSAVRGGDRTGGRRVRRTWYRTGAVASDVGRSRRARVGSTRPRGRGLRRPMALPSLPSRERGEWSG